MYMVDMARIVGTTVVTPEFVNIVPNVDDYYPAEAVIEYASRLCYNSNEKFGTNPNFIKGLIKAGHLDVLEHSAITMKFEVTKSSDADFYKDLYELKEKFPYFKFNVRQIWNQGRSINFFWAGNLRTFVEYCWNWKELNNWIAVDTFAHIQATLHAVAPNIFDLAWEIKDSQKYWTAKDEYERIVLAALDSRQFRTLIPSTTLTGASVVPIGFMSPVGMARIDFFHSAYLVNNVSRAFSHQHVRHRLLSFSQMSQRYVDYDKQGDGFVYPTNIGLTEKAILDETFENIKVAYHALRTDKMKKEDARVVLPNAAITHLVFSGFQDGLDHYIKLRTAKDAQEEIRLVAELVKEHNRSLLWRT